MDPEKLKSEKDNDFKLYLQYLQMKRRSIVQLSLELNLPLKKLQALAKLNKWESRAKQYDYECLELFKKKKEEVISALAEDQAKEEILVNKINNELIKEILLKYLIKEKSSEDININIRDLEKLSTITKRQEVQVNVSGSQDYSKLSDEELKQLEKLAGKIG